MGRSILSETLECARLAAALDFLSEVTNVAIFYHRVARKLQGDWNCFGWVNRGVWRCVFSGRQWKAAASRPHSKTSRIEVFQ
jgi:hypothetical protein